MAASVTADRSERLALSPDGHTVAVRAYQGGMWLAVNTARVAGQHLSDLPADWTRFTPASDRDLAADTLDSLLQAAEEITAELRYLRRGLPKVEAAPDPFALAESLRRVRSESGLSLRALEAEIGVPFNCLSRVERGVGLASPINAQRIHNWLSGYEPTTVEPVS